MLYSPSTPRPAPDMTIVLEAVDAFFERTPVLRRLGLKPGDRDDAVRRFAQSVQWRLDRTSLALAANGFPRRPSHEVLQADFKTFINHHYAGKVREWLALEGMTDPFKETSRVTVAVHRSVFKTHFGYETMGKYLDCPDTGITDMGDGWLAMEGLASPAPSDEPGMVWFSSDERLAGKNLKQWQSVTPIHSQFRIPWERILGVGMLTRDDIVLLAKHREDKTGMTDKTREQTCGYEAERLCKIRVGKQKRKGVTENGIGLVPEDVQCDQEALVKLIASATIHLEELEKKKLLSAYQGETEEYI
jgi:hypothetical protein